MHANPHDDLSPNMSALLITAHVKEGISIAMLSKLPRVIIDILQQHHGTSLVTYFHHKAREQLMRDDGNRNRASTALNEGDFRYAGPKPASREAAIILLADAVEAASRSLAKPTPHHIRNLVDEIVADKMQDGQLDDCSMTFAQLRQVRESFIFTLANMAHSRIPYPKNDNRHHQPAEH
jgi:membrane-associated HD superfamily phosphohydrolase